MQTLYRKYRPQSFNDVVGQDQVVSALKLALKSNKISHAYIFAGTRGTGKTSIARIFGAELNISQNDLYEIDAASNRGIDDIRAIKDAVNTLPFDSKYKLYIIDEAHMLTREAWNALLKTLEEPPSHVIFILATTESSKIPDTILSRCELYNFRKPDEQTLKKVITSTAKKEGYQIDGEASEIIALLADGSFRDAHGALQKVIGSMDGKKITEKDVEAISGAPRQAILCDFINSLADSDTSSLLKALHQMENTGVEVRIFMRLVVEKIRQIILVRISKDTAESLKENLTKESYDFVVGLSDPKGRGAKINSQLLLKLLDILELVSHSSLPQVALEAGVLSVVEG